MGRLGIGVLSAFLAAAEGTCIFELDDDDCAPECPDYGQLTCDEGERLTFSTDACGCDVPECTPTTDDGCASECPVQAAPICDENETITVSTDACGCEFSECTPTTDDGCASECLVQAEGEPISRRRTRYARVAEETREMNAARGSRGASTMVGIIPVASPGISGHYSHMALRDGVEALEAILQAGHSVTSIERRLRLSPGYLSKVRRGVVRPSFQLAGLLALVARDPADMLAVLDELSPPLSPAQPQSGLRTGDDGPALAVIAATELLASAHVRVGLLGARCYVPSARGVLELVVHEHDREALRHLRGAGFVCAHHSSALFRCEYGTERFSLRFPTLPPLETCFARIQRREVDGRVVPVIDPVTTALWFSLSRHEDAVQDLAAVLSTGLADPSALKQELAALNSLPPTRSSYVLQSFDRALAASRFAELLRPA